MKFAETGLIGAVMVMPEPIEDERGLFARAFCRREFAAHGLNPNLAQCSVSFNPRKGTLRGMHYQGTPYSEAKLIRCTRGTICDVVIDLHRESPTYRRWFSVELSADNRKMLYVAEGCAHGFLTLTDDTEVFYQISEFYSAEHQRGVRWNDPAIGIAWPSVPQIISAKDAGFSDFIP
jgi:dTDP-4-dehydrorhamnose 3,5-epimerase